MEYQTEKIKNLDELFEKYIDECRYIKQLRKATIKSYIEVFKNFKNQIPEIIKITDLTPSLIIKFFTLLGEKESQTSTIRTYYDKLMAFFRWLENYHYIPQGTLIRYIVRPPNPTYEDSKALSDSDIARIQSAVMRLRINDNFLLKRDTLIISILIYTGVRKGELLGLRMKDIDWNNRQLFINSETSKSKKSRSIPINPTLFMHLKTYVQELLQLKIKNEYLLLSSKTYKKFTEHGIKHWVQRYKEYSGVSFHLHRFRHTFACSLAKCNADISSIKRVMGHSSITMTERYLRSITTEDARKYIEDLSY